MRIVFMGTPAFAVPSLEALIAAGHQVCGVFSQPDKPVGRHQGTMRPTAVKACAIAHGLPVFQPTGLRDATVLAQLEELSPELIVVAAYGRMLPDNILILPPKGCVNVHSSLLPKYRGSAPIHWAVINGDARTGVTIMHMGSELDAGDVIDQVSTPIFPNETVEAVHDRLSALGGDLLVKVVAKIADGTAGRTAQDSTQVTMAPMLSRALSPIDWTMPAHALHNRIRGLTPWPATSTDAFSSEPVKVFTAVETGTETKGVPGCVVAAGKDGIDVVCGDGMILRILELQAPGSRRMSAVDYLRGHPISF